MSAARVRLGLERLGGGPAPGGGGRVRIFAPEHGRWGVAQDMEAVPGERELVLGLPVTSLYGASAGALAPCPEHLAGLDALVVDLPDIGCRHYTFAAPP